MTAVIIDDEEFATYWNNPEDYPSLQDIADELGVGYQVVKGKGRRMKKRRSEGEISIPELMDRSGSINPLPELQYTFFPEMTDEQCLEKIRELWKVDPSRNITRIRFREETGISDTTWNRYFGTFLEFKRQAGLELSRHQHAVERKLAIHTSVDHYREFNTRHEYGDRYNKPSGSRIKTIIGCSDLHDIEIDPFYLRVLIETIGIVKPDVINLGGDIFDLAEFGKYSVDPREWDPVGRIKFVHENILAPMREASPDSQIDFVEGNHEFRLLRHLADASPALQAVLSDLHGLTVPKLLGLDAYEVNYIAKADLAAFNKASQHKEVEKSYVVYDDALLVHHHPHAKEWGMPGWNGHHHHSLLTRRKCVKRGSMPWLQLGCGHRLRASYANGEFWSLGFNICHLNTQTKSVNFENVEVTDMACVGGLYFERRPEEMVGFYATGLED